MLIGRTEDIDGFDGALRAQLDGHGEVVAARLLLDGVAAVDARQVHEGRLHDARLALDGLHHALCEPEARVRHAQRGGAGAVLGLDDFIAAELDACVVVVSLRCVWKGLWGKGWAYAL